MRLTREATHAPDQHGTRVRRIAAELPLGAWPAAYVGTDEGTLLTVFALPGPKVVAQPVLTAGAGDVKPLRMAAGMTVPRVLSAHPSIDTGQREIDGIAIVEGVIDKSGNVTAVRVLKSLPGDVDIAAETIVRRSTFEPSRWFGVPIPVYYNLSVGVDSGVVRLETTR